MKAAGGCSAPAAKNLDEANSNLGQMKFRELADADAKTSQPSKEGIFMMKHPNNSGLQMDQITHLYVPARYVNSLRISQGDDLILAVTGGISISEDPNFRFSFAPNGAHEFTPRRRTRAAPASTANGRSIRRCETHAPEL